jgi:hypothetical protein
MKDQQQNQHHAAPTIEGGTSGKSRLSVILEEAGRIRQVSSKCGRPSQSVRLTNGKRALRAWVSRLLLATAQLLIQASQRVAAPSGDTPVAVLARRFGLSRFAAKVLLARADTQQPMRYASQRQSTMESSHLEVAYSAYAAIPPNDQELSHGANNCKREFANKCKMKEQSPLAPARC